MMGGSCAFLFLALIQAQTPSASLSGTFLGSENISVCEAHVTGTQLREEPESGSKAKSCFWLQVSSLGCYRSSFTHRQKLEGCLLLSPPWERQVIRWFFQSCCWFSCLSLLLGVPSLLQVFRRNQSFFILSTILPVHEAFRVTVDSTDTHSWSRTPTDQSRVFQHWSQARLTSARLYRGGNGEYTTVEVRLELLVATLSQRGHRNRAFKSEACTGEYWRGPISSFHINLHRMFCDPVLSEAVFILRLVFFFISFL